MLQELHPHDVTRFLFSAAHNHYADKPVLQRVADFVTSHEPDAFQIAGISIVAWSFCKLQFSHEKFLSWLVENTQEKLPNALPQALANIMLALQTFGRFEVWFLKIFCHVLLLINTLCFGIPILKLDLCMKRTVPLLYILSCMMIAGSR